MDYVPIETIKVSVYNTAPFDIYIEVSIRNGSNVYRQLFSLFDYT